jgi:hypothetical protein
MVPYVSLCVFVPPTSWAVAASSAVREQSHYRFVNAREGNVPTKSLRQRNDLPMLRLLAQFAFNPPVHRS